MGSGGIILGVGGFFLGAAGFISVLVGGGRYFWDSGW